VLRRAAERRIVRWQSVMGGNDLKGISGPQVVFSDGFAQLKGGRKGVIGEKVAAEHDKHCFRA
jgi:hypothetical protein